MHYPMFSHAPEPVDQQRQHNGEERTVALYVESTLEPHETWAALTEYIHLWWPRQLLQSEESHIDLSHRAIARRDRRRGYYSCRTHYPMRERRRPHHRTLPGYTPGAAHGRS